MASLLTNTNSMVALSTLRNINMSLADVQSQISTGKSVSNARDNAAVYAISSVMESDVKGFEAISSSLSLGTSSVAVARGASEQINELLQDIKGSIVAAQEDNVDRSKIQTDITRLRDQINSIVDAAQFNGLNLLKEFESIDVLASLDRGADQSLSASTIVIDRFNLTTDAGAYNDSGTVFTTTGITYTDVGGDSGIDNDAREVTLTVGGTVAANDTFTVQIGNNDFTATATSSTLADVQNDLISQIAAAGIEGITAVAGSGAGEIDIQNTSPFLTYDITASETGAAATLTPSGPTTLDQRADSVEILGRAVSGGDGYRITIDNQVFDYVAKEGDDINDVAAGLKAAIDLKAPTIASTSGVTVQVQQSLNPTADAATLLIDNSSASTLAVTIEAKQAGTATGGLRALESIDVSTEDGASRALDNIEALIQTSIDAASSFGSAQKRIDIQSEFIINLTDSLKSGIGSLVDADLEAASAELQSLQVQQQLGIQALSIANQGPQSLLSLFR
ncbi:MAG: flagellin [Pseudomonadota bacterium]